ncbi:MAG: class I SAM-dependent methyltransferase [Pseudomonadota bacterium]
MADTGEQMRAAIDLSGVPETMLWPLWHRVGVARGGESLLPDPVADDLVNRIDYPFQDHFGKPSVFAAIRARYCDDLIRTYVGIAGTEALVIGLGEGLETQPWRLADSTPNWFSVDLPEAIAVRERLLPHHPRTRLIAGSAFDTDWMDQIPSGSKPFITASGLLMYFAPDAIKRMLAGIAERFPGAELFFDTLPPMFGASGPMRVTRQYTSPELPWRISIDDVPSFLVSCGWSVVSSLTYAEPYPDRLRFYAFLSKIGPIRRRLAPGLIHARTTDFGMSRTQ